MGHAHTTAWPKSGALQRLRNYGALSILCASRVCAAVVDPALAARRQRERALRFGKLATCASVLAQSIW